MLLDVELAWVFLRRRTGLLLRGTALAALLGIALATMALVITLALMEGYSQSIATALQRGNAHIVGFAPGGLEYYEALILAQKIGNNPGVRGASPVCYITALAEDPSEPFRPRPIVIKGVGSPPRFIGLNQWPDTSSGAEISSGIGFELARHLKLKTGDILRVKLPPKPGSWLMPQIILKVLSTFRLDFSEFDRRWVVVPLKDLLAVLPSLKTAGIEIMLDDPGAVEAVREELEQIAPKLLFSDWREMNASLFSALRWQTLSLFVVLSLVVAVASFQVSSALVVLSIDKRRSTGMLQAMGATRGRVWRILSMAGFFLGSAGLVFGLLVGAGICEILNITRAVRFPEDLARIYLIDHVPFILSFSNMAAIAGISLGLIIAASLWPALRSARMDPSRAIKAV